MQDDRTGEIAVIFTSRRTADDPVGYDAAAEAMATLAAAQPGYRGTDSVRDDGDVGITVSYWSDETAALAWRQHAEHSVIRAQGRERWYEWYRVSVARIERSYAWARP